MYTCSILFLVVWDCHPFFADFIFYLYSFACVFCWSSHFFTSLYPPLRLSQLMLLLLRRPFVSLCCPCHPCAFMYPLHHCPFLSSLCLSPVMTGLSATMLSRSTFQASKPTCLLMSCCLNCCSGNTRALRCSISDLKTASTPPCCLAVLLL